MTKFLTIREGERVLIWNQRGQARYVDGPAQPFLFNETAQRLTRYAAKTDQYLIVRFHGGQTQHLRGPTAVWFDPVQHVDIKIEEATKIDAHEATVVYRQEGETVKRRVVHGPAVFVPEAQEWLHRFSWHGADPKDPRKKIPHALRFTKLWVIPDQMYFDVEDVRTADDALLVIKLMIFFELHDIERMLDQTHDPVADFINAVTADAIDFAGKLTFENFKDQTERLNRLETYAHLIQRAERIGYKITKVVYRGYYASDALQTMHDHAIEVRTKLRLEAETEEQTQELADMKLNRELERIARQQDMEEKKIHHQNRLKQLQHEEAIRQLGTERATQLEAKKKENELALDHQHLLNEEQTRFLGSIQTMGVDLTRYLVAQHENPDKIIRINADQPTRLHLHEKE
jgi:hypothetical protein